MRMLRQTPLTGAQPKKPRSRPLERDNRHWPAVAPYKIECDRLRIAVESAEIALPPAVKMKETFVAELLVEACQSEDSASSPWRPRYTSTVSLARDSAAPRAFDVVPSG